MALLPRYLRRLETHLSAAHGVITACSAKVFPNCGTLGWLAVIRAYRKVDGAVTIGRNRAGLAACAAQERTPDRPAWENAGFRNHADHTATPEFRAGMAELRDGSGKKLGRYAASWIACWPKRPSSTAALI
jgi:hypothetical protein